MQLCRAAGFPSAPTGVVDRSTLALAVRHTLVRFADAHPGHAVEVRVPPYAAVQCLPGPRHKRGTPPNVVEMDAGTWLRLFAGDLTWLAAVDSGLVRASGDRADLGEHLPSL